MSHTINQDPLLGLSQMLGEAIHRLQNPPPVDKRLVDIWADNFNKSISLIDENGTPFVIKAKLGTEAGEVIRIDETLPFAKSFDAWNYLYLLAEMEYADIAHASINPARQSNEV